MSEPPNKDKNKSAADGTDSSSLQSIEESPGTSAPQDKRRIRKFRPTVANASQISQDTSQDSLYTSPEKYLQNSERPLSNDNDNLKAQTSKQQSHQPSTSLGASSSKVSGLDNILSSTGSLWNRAKEYVIPPDNVHECKRITDWPESGCIHIPLRPPGSSRNENEEEYDTEEN